MRSLVLLVLLSCMSAARAVWIRQRRGNTQEMNADCCNNLDKVMNEGGKIIDFAKPLPKDQVDRCNKCVSVTRKAKKNILSRGFGYVRSVAENRDHESDYDKACECQYDVYGFRCLPKYGIPTDVVTDPDPAKTNSRTKEGKTKKEECANVMTETSATLKLLTTNKRKFADREFLAHRQVINLCEDGKHLAKLAKEKGQAIKIMSPLAAATYTTSRQNKGGHQATDTHMRRCKVNVDETLKFTCDGEKPQVVGTFDETDCGAWVPPLPQMETIVQTTMEGTQHFAQKMEDPATRHTDKKAPFEFYYNSFTNTKLPTGLVLVPDQGDGKKKDGKDEAKDKKEEGATEKKPAETATAGADSGKKEGEGDAEKKPAEAAADDGGKKEKDGAAEKRSEAAADNGKCAEGTKKPDCLGSDNEECEWSCYNTEKKQKKKNPKRTGDSRPKCDETDTSKASVAAAVKGGGHCVRRADDE